MTLLGKTCPTGDYETNFSLVLLVCLFLTQLNLIMTDWAVYLYFSDISRVAFYFR